ncbi:bifunctional 4-hydroxy-2-oxoglutarate aldolase/2-dehydro-3-deoxy-phosphogluconate aldolase [Microbacterium sp. RU33B]|uniref:bifunctional 4-hydroxy-2-oxoglutarate aldolase/2-dehydro-3-deoxy-phosphogluconate aldolase n=1 Tax=Microbacterium sp. RU33B TaxID=1907390 RepID=UPI0009671CAC|nr:bifunctional 4-hydroxy-2-oxoglutarate aldolase/2-dehydro-3-deoxy-phosphogluconate aldolase [Microbacterium sp. RU33B]SIT89771.1 2-dehydro-3-deoxyphosphogluconate aldolase / (4S)-4-hydroxy-2-oxoglutarate aldolase [Microbacterium sp. RU33B]
MTGFDRMLGGVPVMAILRGYGAERTVALARRAWELGVTCVEVPLQTERDAEALAALVDAARPHGHPVGAGTILDVEGAQRAQELGAVFTVSPGLDADVARASLGLGMPHLPGVATATEVHQARKLGLEWLKAFPASDIGAEWITAMLAPFPEARFVATGGVSARNAKIFLEAGARAVAVGSALDDPAQLPMLQRILAARSES